MKYFLSFALALGILGCGAEKVTALPAAVETGVPLEWSVDFASEQLSADIKGIARTSGKEKSYFEVRFKPTSARAESDPTREPSRVVGAFIRMTCCGSIFFPKVEKVSDGFYRVSEVDFTPGEWEVYLQLTDPNGEVEKHFHLVNLND